MNCKNQSKRPGEIVRIHGCTNLSAPLEIKNHLRQMQIYINTMIDLCSGYKVKGTEFWEHSCYEEIVQRYGQYFVAPNVIGVVNANVESRYQTAFDSISSGIVYCEGFVLLKGENTPTDHAWLYDLNLRKVIDFAYGYRSNLYYGIPLSADFIQARMKETGRAGIFITDLETEEPVLKEGLPETAIVHFIRDDSF